MLASAAGELLLLWGDLEHTLISHRTMLNRRFGLKLRREGKLPKRLGQWKSFVDAHTSLRADAKDIRRVASDAVPALVSLHELRSMIAHGWVFISSPPGTPTADAEVILLKNLDSIDAPGAADYAKMPLAAFVKAPAVMAELSGLVKKFHDYGVMQLIDLEDAAKRDSRRSE